MVAGEVVDSGDDWTQRGRQVVQDQGVRLAGQLPPLPVGVRGGRKAGQGGMRRVAEQAHGAGLLPEPDRAPEDRGEPAGHRGDRPLDQQQNPLAGRQGSRGGEPVAGDDDGLGRRRELVGIDPDRPVVLGRAVRQRDVQAVSRRGGQAGQRALDGPEVGQCAGRAGRRREGAFLYVPAVGSGEPPARGAGGQIGRAVVRQCGGSRQRLGGGVDALGQAHQRYGRVAEPPPVGRLEQPFAVPERVEDADQRGALAREVVQVEQGEAAQAGSAEQTSISPCRATPRACPRRG